MKLDSNILEYLKRMNAFNQSVEKFFKAVAIEVERLDEKGWLLPPELDSIEWHLQWSLNKAVIDQLQGEKNLLFFEEDCQEDDSAWSLVDGAVLGLYFWSPAMHEAALSVYMYFDDEDEGIAYGKAKIASRLFQGRFYLFSDDWSEIEIELLRFDLKSLMESESAHYMVAEEVVNQAKRIIDTSYPK